MFFIDLYKDGQLDLISHRLSSTASYYTWDKQASKSSQIEIYFNNVHYDAFFMKVRVMKGPDYKEIHNNLVIPGGNVNCFVTSLSGEMLPKVGNQYSQLGRVLHLPYVFFGLGRTNNYVNELTITIPYVPFPNNYRSPTSTHTSTCGPRLSPTVRSWSSRIRKERGSWTRLLNPRKEWLPCRFWSCCRLLCSGLSFAGWRCRRRMRIKKIWKVSIAF